MHSLIIGMTESGKTTLAKIICGELKKRGHRTAVLDPVRDPEWDADFQTQNPSEFLEFARRNLNYYLFVDEGAQSIGRFNDPMEWLATGSRHYGHSCFFISQSFTQLSPTLRGQCSKLYIFACALTNAKTAAEEWNEPTLKNLEKIDKGEFYVVSRFEQLKRGRVDFDQRVVYDGGDRRSEHGGSRHADDPIPSDDDSRSDPAVPDGGLSPETERRRGEQRLDRSKVQKTGPDSA